MSVVRLPINLSEVKDKSVYEIAQQLTKLKKSGRQYVGLCPFHDEDTPSFFVNPEKNVWYCFGCGRGGGKNALLHELGIEFNKVKSEVSVLEQLINTCHRNLLSNNIAIEELKKLGFSELDIKEFKIGYIDSETRCSQAVNEKLEEFGISRNHLGPGAILVPIYSTTLSGFILRTFDGKYINQKQSNVKKLLLGLRQALDSIRETGKIILVEGVRDVMAYRKYGIFNVVATLGVPVTQEQIKLAEKFADEIVFSFDFDKAGIKAVLSALTKLKFNSRVKVMVLPSGKDPADLAKEDILPEATKEISVWKFLKALKVKPEQAVKILNSFTNNIIKFEEAKELAAEYDIPVELVQSRVKKSKKGPKITLTADEKIALWIMRLGYTPSPELFTSEDISSVFSGYEPEKASKILCLLENEALDVKDIKDELRERLYSLFEENIPFAVDPLEYLITLRVVEEILHLNDDDYML